MSSPTVSHQFVSVSGRLSSNSSVTVSLSSGYHPQTNGQTERRFKRLGDISGPTGTASSRGWGMHKIPLKQTPSSAYLGYPSVSLDRGALRPTPAGSAETQTYADVRQSSTPSIVLEIRSGSPPGICVSACPAGKLSPRYIGPFTIERQINDGPHSVSNSLHGIISIQYSMSHSSSLSLPLSQNLTSLQYLLLPEIIEEPLVCRVQEILDSGDGVVDWNILLTGREDPGWPGTMCWIPLSGRVSPEPPWPSRTRGRGRPHHRNRASGGGYCQRITTVTAVSLTTLTISQSPDF